MNLDYNIWPRVEREFDEGPYRENCPDTYDAHQDNGDHDFTFESTEFDDYEQQEVDADEETGDTWEDLGCSWRDFV